MNIFREIEDEVERWMAGAGPSYYGAVDKTSLGSYQSLGRQLA